MAKPKASEKLKAEYLILLTQCRIGKSKAVGNRYPWQCQSAIRELTRFAAERQGEWGGSESPTTIRILTGTLPNYVFGCTETTKALAEFVEAGGRIRVIVWAKTLDTKNNLFSRFATTFDRSVEIRVSRTDHLGDRINHFFVVDDYAYRLEEPHTPTQPDKFDDFEPEIPARIAFDDKSIGGTLVNFFDAIWESVTPTA